MGRKEDIQELKEYIINEEMLYLAAGKGRWKQGDGKVINISSMNETHLKNSIKMIERDIQQLENRDEEIKNDLTAIAEDKLEELKDEYLDRINY